MSTLDELVAKRAALEAEIAAAKREGIAEIRKRMTELGITVEDLGPSSRVGSKRQIKYRDANGNTWTGVGQRPRWLRAALLAGAALEDFEVRG